VAEFTISKIWEERHKREIKKQQGLHIGMLNGGSQLVTWFGSLTMFKTNFRKNNSVFEWHKFWKYCFATLVVNGIWCINKTNLSEKETTDGAQVSSVRVELITSPELCLPFLYKAQYLLIKFKPSPKTFLQTRYHLELQHFKRQIKPY
jgi:hypothetical protein